MSDMYIRVHRAIMGFAGGQLKYFVGQSFTVYLYINCLAAVAGNVQSI